jgi:hypothetical protein
MRDISNDELMLVKNLREAISPLPSHTVINESDRLRDALVALQFFLPHVLQEIHPEWRWEGLDEIYPAVARKVGDDEVEIVGLCCFVSDQTLTPLHVRLQLDSSVDAVSWLECHVGESTGKGMRRVPYSQGTVNGNKLHVLKRLGSIDWAYRVGFGERRPDSPVTERGSRPKSPRSGSTDEI